MSKSIGSPGPDHGEADPRHAGRSLRIAMLVLLKERECHGYELFRRLATTGFVGPSATQIYRLLRTMERTGLINATWDLSDKGPARRVYSLTPSGDQYLRDQVPSLLAERDALQVVLASYRRLVKRHT
jgi:PadR family transcriptional regulator PadR